MEQDNYYQQLISSIEFHEAELKRLNRNLEIYEDAHKDNPLLFGNKLRHVMKMLNVTQSRLADAVGLSRRSISRYVNSEVVPSIMEQMRIMRVLTNMK